MRFQAYTVLPPLDCGALTLKTTPSRVWLWNDTSNPNPPCRNLGANGAAVIVIGLLGFYLALEPFAGLTWAAAIGLPLVLSATAVAEVMNTVPPPPLASVRRGHPADTLPRLIGKRSRTELRIAGPLGLRASGRGCVRAPVFPGAGDSAALGALPGAGGVASSCLVHGDKQMGPDCADPSAWLQVEMALWYGLAAVIVGLYVQVHPGHMLLEGRRPAFVDSFFQVRAPLGRRLKARGSRPRSLKFPW